jgi:penicillin amidase
MNHKRHTILIIVAILLFLTATVSFLYFHETPLPDGGSIILPPLISTVEIITDEHKFCHLYAQNDHDLFLTLGYLHASRHLVEMDKFQRAANGTLSEVFGASTNSIDVLSRTIGFHNFAEKNLNTIDPEVALILQAYCNGINTYTEQNRYNLPKEFKWKHYHPALWQPADCLAIQRMLAWLLSDHWLKKMVFYKLLEVYGLEKVSAGFPAIQNWPDVNFPQYGTLFFPPVNLFLSANLKLRDFLGLTTQRESCNWVIAQDNPTNSGTIMNIHLPEYLLDFHEISELVNPRFEVIGTFIPGIPFSFSGQNADILWNASIQPLDNLELLIFPISENQDAYQYKNQWQPFEEHVEKLIRRRHSDTTFSIRSTAFGPVIGYAPDPSANFAIVLKWKGLDFTDDFKGLYELNRASSWNEFVAAAEFLKHPATIVDFADKEGNTGSVQYYSDLYYDPIIHNLSTISRVFEPGYIAPIQLLLRDYNPSNGIIFHQTHLPDNTVPGKTQLMDLLSATKMASLENFKSAQIYNQDYIASLFLPIFFEIISDSDLVSPLQKQAFKILKEWDCRSQPSSVAYGIFQTFTNQLFTEIYQDELDLADQQLFDQLRKLNDLNTRNIVSLLSSGESEWFDDIRTPEFIERRKEITLRAFQNAIQWLANTHSPNFSEWTPLNIFPAEGLISRDLFLTLTPQREFHLVQGENRKPVSFLNTRKYSISEIRLKPNNRFELISKNAKLLSLLPAHSGQPVKN